MAAVCMHSVGSTADGQSVQCQYGPGMPLMNGAYILYGSFPLCVSLSLCVCVCVCVCVCWCVCAPCV